MSKGRETPNTDGQRDLEKETLRPVLLLLLRPIFTFNTLVSAFLSTDMGLSFQ